MSNQKDIYLIQPRMVSTPGLGFRSHPPDGLAYLAGYLLRQGFEVGLLDSRAEGHQFAEQHEEVILHGLPDEQVVQRVSPENPRVIGINYSFSTDFVSVQSLVQTLRNSGYDGMIALGGTGASPLHRQILSDTDYAGEMISGVDVVACDRNLGGGELPIEGLVRSIKGSGDLSSVQGISYRTKDGKVETTRPSTINLRNISTPARELYTRNEDGIDIYSALNNPHSGPIPEEHLPYATIMTSRGCMYDCTFCLESKVNEGFNPGWERRPIKEIKREIDLLSKEGINAFLIQDENFGGSTERSIDDACMILGYMAEKGASAIYFPNGVTVSSLLKDNSAFLKKIGDLSRAGINIRLGIPIESGSDDILALVRKPHRLSHLEQLFSAIKEQRLDEIEQLNLEAWAMAGMVAKKGDRYVHETLKQIEATISYLERIGERFPRIEINLWFFKPIPGIEAYQLWKEKHPTTFDSHLLFEHQTPGIWGTPQEEKELYRRIVEFNQRLRETGHASTRPMFPEKLR